MYQKHQTRVIIGSALIALAFLFALFEFCRYLYNSREPLIEPEIVKQQCAESKSDESEQAVVDFVEETIAVNSGDTLISIFKRVHMQPQQQHKVVKALNTVLNPKELKPGLEINFVFDGDRCGRPEKSLLSLSIKLKLDQEIIVLRNKDGGFEAKKETRQLVKEVRVVKGEINETLFRAVRKKGVSNKIFYQLVQAFSYDLDFQRSLKVGDHFELMYEVYKDPKSGDIKSGNLLYATMKVNKQTLSVYRYKDSSGHVSYYNSKGNCVRKGLLRTPVNGARISSGFGTRKHPILGYTKKHKGIDFAAPKGTPIMAAGSGTIERIGRFGSYGHYIRIKHNSEYATAYAHLCRYAKNLKKGMHVDQGQVIGYVGATGRAKGAHLHYEVIRHGKQINPKSVKMVPSKRLQGREYKLFVAQKQVFDKQFTHTLALYQKGQQNSGGQTDIKSVSYQIPEKGNGQKEIGA